MSLIKGVKEGIFSKANNMKNTVVSAIDSGTNYYAFATFFIVGCLFLLLAFTFLPVILIAPAKFNMFFSLGSFFMQLSLAFFHGPLNYIKIIFTKENLLISLLYVGSMLFAIYSALFWGNYFSSILIVGLQVRFVLIWLII